MATDYNGIAGIRHTYGSPDRNDPSPGVESTRGLVREHVIHFEYDSLPANHEGDALVQAIPAYSVIVGCVLGVETAFAGGTSYDIGLVTADGTEVDNDGLFAGLVTASINAKGKWVSGNGVLLPSNTSADATPVAVVTSLSGVGAADAYVKAVATGTFTAGKAKLIISYIPLDAN